MDDELRIIEDTMALVGELKAAHEIKSSDSGDPLLYVGVVTSDVIAQITPVVERYFGGAFKPAGKSAFFKNILDSFSKSIGGIRKEQTVFRKNISQSLDMYCAFWPWGSNPVKTTVRIGVLLRTEMSVEMVNKMGSTMEKFIKE